MKEKTLNFEASAYLQTLIGRELVRSDEVALVELVKNAYDAGARRILIRITPPSIKEPGEIEIRDDGQGMTVGDFKHLFLFAGYSERPDQLHSGNRVPTGEKGIGRFATDRLGRKLTVITKVKEERSALRVKIDWDAFRSRKKKFHDIYVPYESIPAAEFPEGENGTILRIERLATPWPREKILTLRTALDELLDPFNRPQDFEIDLQISGAEKLSGRIEPQPPQTADIVVKFEALKSGKVKRLFQSSLFESTKTSEEIGTSANVTELSGLKGKLLYFVVRPRKKELKGYRAGVNLYRDGFRVQPFGTPTADWLGVSEKKAKRAGHAHIVPSHLFGFISISRRDHPELKDTTSREALIHTEAVNALLTFLHEQLRFLEDTIRSRITEPRWKESKTRQAVQLEQARLQNLSILSVGLAHELRQPLQSIRTEAENISTRLKQLGVIDSEIEEAQKNIDADVDRIDKNIRLVASISSGNLSDITELDLAELVREQCSLFETRCSAKGIDLTVDAPAKQIAVTNQTTITTALLNLLKNAIDTLMDVSDTRQKKISVKLSRAGAVHQLQVSDNGSGIEGEIRPKIFKKFASKKTGGWGVGLYNSQVLVRAQGGNISFQSKENIGTTFRVEISDAKVK